MGYQLDCDYRMSLQEKADLVAFTALVEERLYNVQKFNWWLEIENYSRFTHNIYANLLYFPLNWWIPHQIKDKVTQQLEQAGYTIQDKKNVYRLAQECFEVLSAKLGSKNFFYGNEPCTLDCVVYGFLMIQYSARLPKYTLRVLISKHKNLVEFCYRITKNYFYTDSPSLLRPPPRLLEEKKSKKKSHELIQHEHKSSLIILSGLIVVAIYSAFMKSAVQDFLLSGD